MGHIDTNIFESMEKNYLAATKNYEERHKSKHWNVFPENYVDVIRKHDDWPDLRRNHIASGMGGTRRYESHFADLARSRYRHILTTCGADFVAQTMETAIGNPWTTAVDGGAVDLHDALLVYNAWRIKTLAAALPQDRPLHIIDIGGGYGGYALKLKKIFPSAKIILLDLPETNAIQTYYLSRALPNAVILGAADFADGASPLAQDFDFAILPGWYMSSLPDQWADLVVNMRSFMEMDRAVVADYIRQIERSIAVGGLFYCVNRYMKATIGEENRAKDYPFDAKWLALMNETLWSQTHIHELACVRLAHDNAIPLASAMAALPPYTFDEVASAFCEAMKRLNYFLFSRNGDIKYGQAYKLVLLAKSILRPLYRLIRRR